MRTCMLSILGLILMLALSTTVEARNVTVWLLEVQYTSGDSWHNAGKYTSYASAQQSYAVRARHGGYFAMRIRQTQEWQPSITDRLRVNAATRYRLFP